MSAIKSVFICAVAVGGLALPFAMYVHTSRGIAGAEQSLRERAEEAAKLSTAESQRKVRMAEAAKIPPLSPEELSELLRLRSEVGRMRKDAAELEKARETNAKLKAARSANLQAAQAAERNADFYWREDQLIFAGYASPEAAMKTTLWAMSRGDMDSLLNCMAPEFRSATEEKLGAGEGSNAKVQGVFTRTIGGASAFRLTAGTTSSPDQATIGVSFEGGGVSQQFSLKQIDGDWKIQEMHVLPAAR